MGGLNSGESHCERGGNIFEGPLSSSLRERRDRRRAINYFLVFLHLFHRIDNLSIHPCNFFRFYRLNKITPSWCYHTNVVFRHLLPCYTSNHRHPCFFFFNLVFSFQIFGFSLWVGVSSAICQTPSPLPLKS